MVIGSRNHQIISQVLAMDENDLSSFLASLTPDTRAYLEVVLAKAEQTVPHLKQYLDTINRLRT